jgi:hypothetical protein
MDNPPPSLIIPQHRPSLMISKTRRTYREARKLFRKS